MTGSSGTSPGTIRPLSPQDLEAVIALDAAATGRSRRGFFEKRLKAALDAPEDYVYVGLHDDSDRLTGFALAALTGGAFGRGQGRAALDVIGVAPDQRGRGAGRMLLDRVRQVLRRKGVTMLETAVDWSDRSLLGFFGRAGFVIAPRLILRRDATALPERLDDADPPEDAGARDFSSPEGDDPGALSRDRVPVRSLSAGDIDAIIRIDRALSGRDRSDWLRRKLREVTVEAGVRVSLVAEQDGMVVGYVMARVDFGEFGLAISEAVMDAIGVAEGFQGQGIGHALLARLIANLGVLRVEGLRTETAWNDVGLIAFFSDTGFAPAQRIALEIPV